MLRAREEIAGRVHRTPTLGSRTLGERLGGTRAYLKAELFQRTGSFKPRGVLNRLGALTPEERARGVVTWSAGNHAQAVAYAAAREGIDCLVLMWRTASPIKVAAARGYGATVDVGPADAAAAYDVLLETIERTGRTFVDPFDHPLVMAGQGTVGLELVEDMPDVDLVVVPVGGGGLVSGVATAVKALRPQARVVGVEPEGAAGLSAGLAAGRSVRIEPHSIADGLAPPFAGERCIAVARERVDDVVLVTEAEIEEGMRFLYSRAKLACEPAGAAATGALLAGKIPVEPGSAVAAVVSGGNTDPKIASGILGARHEG